MRKVLCVLLSSASDKYNSVHTMQDIEVGIANQADSNNKEQQEQTRFGASYAEIDLRIYGRYSVPEAIYPA